MSINTLLSLGLILLLGLIASALIRKIKMPAITAYLVLGIVIGPAVLNIISEKIIISSGLISNVVLSFIAFSIGQNFSKKRFSEIGNSVVLITIAQGLGAALAVGAAIYFLTNSTMFVVLALAAIAPATAPAAVVMVVREYKAKGRFTDTLLGVVALDDALGLIFFALLLAVLKSIMVLQGEFIPSALWGIYNGLIEVAGAIVLGGVLGLILSLFSKYVNKSTELLIYTLGFVLFNAGLSLYLGFSVLLSSMAMAAVLVNIVEAPFRFFDSIRSIDSPFYLLFFVLAGANLEFNMLKVMGVIGGIYIIARLVGKILGVFIGAQIAGSSSKIKNYLGIGLAPQAGVALGMALIVSSVFPKEGKLVMSIIVATTVIYEIFGPLLTKVALHAAGEIEN
ncbi:cation:proton antiporter [Elusimicrobiota bacterium]